MARSFIRDMRSKGVLPPDTPDPVQNAENDLDFTYQTPRGSAYLELMEIVPSSFKGYDSPSGVIKPYDLAASVIESILNKSRRYASRTSSGIDLLLYPTHWANSPSTMGLYMLSYWLWLHKHCFDGCFYWQPLNADEGTFQLLFPRDSIDFLFFNPEEHRDRHAINLDPSAFELHQG